MSQAPDWLRHWLESGDAILLVIAILCAEALGIALLLQRKSLPVLIGLAPGLCLALALYTALSGADILWTGLWLTSSLPAHLFDLRRRIRAAKQP
ncbi:hypothetical protein [Aquisediminimonas profunda]|uniref:hypothetical protein n=1 Tax=Aquisediminimonas profunda TaxID=1550733 RepID=UPI001C62D3AD|nr:hypothetical protein [Aquisediminimonas profunda]